MSHMSPIVFNRHFLCGGDSWLTLDALSAASLLVGLQSDCFPIISVGSVIRVLVAGADTHEEDAKGGNRCCEDRAACFGRSPDCQSGAEPYNSYFVKSISYQTDRWDLQVKSWTWETLTSFEVLMNAVTAAL